MISTNNLEETIKWITWGKSRDLSKGRWIFEDDMIDLWLWIMQHQAAESNDFYIKNVKF